ncbi:hypothetical protein [Methylocella sp.]|uniref:hypothetical protein n=1 Tax=Methylocella sp. TaxID=1978226 RepID=UPI0037831365
MSQQERAQKRANVFIATPCFGGLVSQHYMQSVLGLVQFAGQAGFDVMLAMLGHDSLITRSRNTLVAQFLAASEATHLLFIDADIAFDARQVADMLAFDEDFVAGVYPLKVVDWSDAAIRRAATLQEGFEAAPLLYVGSPCAGAERRGRFVSAVYCGGGFMLLRRRVVERMIEAYPHLRYEGAHAYSNVRPGPSYALFDCLIDPQTGAYVSEDFAFCQRWRDIGGEIWLDAEGRLTHVGAYNFRGDPRPRLLAGAPEPRMTATP